jgi:hypothetical protein
MLLDLGFVKENPCWFFNCFFGSGGQNRFAGATALHWDTPSGELFWLAFALCQEVNFHLSWLSRFAA